MQNIIEEGQILFPDYLISRGRIMEYLDLLDFMRAVPSLTPCLGLFSYPVNEAPRFVPSSSRLLARIVLWRLSVMLHVCHVKLADLVRRKLRQFQVRGNVEARRRRVDCISDGEDEARTVHRENGDDDAVEI